LTPQFQQQVTDARWQMRFRAGGDVDVWADPQADAWSAPTHDECLGVGSPVLCTPCIDGAAGPDRVILTITLDGYESDAQVWAQKIRAAIATIRAQHPQLQQLVLQPVVGGPDHAICPAPGEPRGVRATFNHPHVDEAIAIVVGDADDLVAGFSPEVHACSDYRDDVGHLTDEGTGAVGGPIGAYYTDLDD
jgi:hypothetical protein